MDKEFREADFRTWERTIYCGKDILAEQGSCGPVGIRAGAKQIVHKHWSKRRLFRRGVRMCWVLQGDQRIDIFGEDFNSGGSYCYNINHFRTWNDVEWEGLHEILFGDFGHSSGQVPNLNFFDILSQTNIDIAQVHTFFLFSNPLILFKQKIILNIWSKLSWWVFMIKSIQLSFLWSLRDFFVEVLFFLFSRKFL